MPSHIYFRLGRYLDALADNKIAAAVDEKYLAATNAPMGVYRLGYYPHNVHFVMFAAQMSGDGPTVIAAAEKLRAVIPDEVARGIAMVHPVKAAPYFAHAQFSPPETILALPDPGDGIPYEKAMWHYARGVAQAARSDFAAAEAESNVIATIERTADFSLLTAVGHSGAGRVNSLTPSKTSVPNAKEMVSLRIDRDILDYFQEAGPGWQDRLNEALRKLIGK